MKNRIPSFYLSSLFVIFFLVSFSFSENVPGKPDPSGLFPVFNVRLGTQTFDPKYQFTSDTKLLETAKQIYEMGSDIIKINMKPQWSGPGYGLAPNDKIKSLVDLAQNESSYRAVLDMPFYYYILWIYPFNEIYWHDGLTAEESKTEYDQVYQLACYLLKTYNGTQKTFLFGHWEGDWWLLTHTNPKNDPTDTAIQGMIDWLTIRQKAVEQARKDTPHENVEIYNYTEVNLVKKAMDGGKTITNNVLPHVILDLVSYSSYDTIFDSTGTFQKALDYIRSKAKTTGHFYRDVFVGEYGFPLDKGARSPGEQAKLTKNTFQTAMAWGCPFVLYWQMYDNEAEQGGANARGFWLIDSKNQKQPACYEHQNFLAKAQSFKGLYRFWLQRNPTEEEFSEFCKTYAALQISTAWQNLVDSTEAAALTTPQEFLEGIWPKLFSPAYSTTKPEKPFSALYETSLNQIKTGTKRSDVISNLLNSHQWKEIISNEAFLELLCLGTQGKTTPDKSDPGYQKFLTMLQSGTSRSVLWTTALDSQDFLLTSLKQRNIQEKSNIKINQQYFFDISTPPGTKSSASGSH